jgi:hypothetical protein
MNMKNKNFDTLSPSASCGGFCGTASALDEFFYCHSQAQSAIFKK